jgi:hypothetical protein
MLFKNIEIFNVSELEASPFDGGYSMLRLPKSVESSLGEQGRRMNRSSVGVEFRFKCDEEISFLLRSKDPEGTKVLLFLGDVQASWDQSSYVVGHEIKKLVVRPNPETSKQVASINDSKGRRYAPDLFRLVFDGSEVELFDVIGKAIPLCDEDFPSTKYLAYGSSITACSLTYFPIDSFAYLLGKAMKADTRNIGFPGSCRLEESVASFLADKTDFDFATIELGINVIAEWDVKTFKEAVEKFLPLVVNSHPRAYFYVIDIFSYFNECCSGVSVEKLEQYRNVVRQITLSLDSPHVYYVRGDKLLCGRNNLASDLVHPDLEGHREIFDNLFPIVKETYGKTNR